MIEILKPEDVDKVQHEKLKSYLDYSFKKLPDDFIYPEYGYFVIIESMEELQKEPVKLTLCQLPSIEEKAFFDFIEVVEQRYDVIEIVFIIHNDFGVSLIIKEEHLSDALLNRLQKYKL